MCKAVQRIHKAKIVHRDIKPGNFLVMRDGTIRLSDFGTARLIEDSSKPILDDYAGWPPGDIRYTAPEIISSLHDVTPHFAFKGDIFSLGATLFERKRQRKYTVDNDLQLQVVGDCRWHGTTNGPSKQIGLGGIYL